MKLLYIISAILVLTSCSKFREFPFPPEKGFGDQVSWRYVLYDSTGQVVDSTRELSTTDTAGVPLLGPSVISVAPELGPHDTIYWGQGALPFNIVVGPSNFGPQYAPVQKGGCGFRSIYYFPTLDRSGWNVQRTENGRTINMFAAPMTGGYDGRYNDFPYPNIYFPEPFPSPFETDLINTTWICGSTQGSCTVSSVF
jgi:hypothetical protein